MARPKRGVTFWDRVWEKTIINKKDGCWEFHGHKDECGHGRIHQGAKLVRIHRESWIRHYGPIPAGLEIRHTCDKPECWNINHLFMSTHAGNMFKGMHGKWRTKLTKEEVQEIRDNPNKLTQAALGKRFGVSDAQIGRIQRGVQWRQLS